MQAEFFEFLRLNQWLPKALDGVFIPNSVLDYLKIKPDPATFFAYEEPYHAPGKKLILIADVYFLAGKDDWVRLNSIKSFQYINYALVFEWQKLVIDHKFDQYIDMITLLLTKYPSRPLTNSFLVENDVVIPSLNVSELTEWTRLDAKKVPLLRGLCGEKIEEKNGNVHISLNVLTKVGAIDHLEIDGRNGKYFEITSFDSKEIYRAGTFSEPAM